MVLDLMRVEDFHYLLVVDFVKSYNVRVMHIENKEKDNTTLNAEKKYVINFSEHKYKFYKKKSVLPITSLHYNGTNIYVFANGVEMYKFKAKYSKRYAVLVF